MPTWSSSKKWPNNNVSVQLMTRNMAEPNSMGQPVRNMGLQPHSEDRAEDFSAPLGQRHGQQHSAQQGTGHK